MEINLLAKIVEISLTVAVLIWVRYQDNKEREKREEFYTRKEEQYQAFTDSVLQDSKKREETLQHQAKDREDKLLSTIERLTDKFDILEDVSDKVEKIKSDMESLTKELK